MRASCAGRFHFEPMKLASCNGDLAGPLAIMICKPRQARKGATVAVSYVPGCGWLGRHPIPPLVLECSCHLFWLRLPLVISLSAARTLVSISAVDRYNRALFLANRPLFE